MRAIVTGGAGFIGSNLVDGLIDRGDEVTIVDDLSTGRAENLEKAIELGAKLVVLDIRDAAELDGAFAAARPQVVFSTSPLRSTCASRWPTPAWDAQINVGGTINVLCCARRSAHGVRIASSTARPAARSTATRARSPPPSAPRRYRRPPTARASSPPRATSASSSACTSLNAVTLRYGNVYGPRQDPLGEAGVIAIFWRQARRRRDADGLRRRPPDARLRLCGRRRGGGNLAARRRRAHGPVNIGTAVETSVLDIVEVLREAGRPRGLPAAQFAPARATAKLARSCPQHRPRARRDAALVAGRLDPRRACAGTARRRDAHAALAGRR